MSVLHCALLELLLYYKALNSTAELILSVDLFLPNDYGMNSFALSKLYICAIDHPGDIEANLNWRENSHQ